MATRAVADEAPDQRGPMGGVLRRPTKCHVTATKRKTCIANKSSAVNQMGDRLVTIHQHHRQTAQTRQDRQRSDSIEEQTVLQTVAQN